MIIYIAIKKVKKIRISANYLDFIFKYSTFCIFKFFNQIFQSFSHKKSDATDILNFQKLEHVLYIFEIYTKMKALAFLGLLLVIVTSKIDVQSQKSRQQFSIKRITCFMVSRQYYHDHRQAIQAIVVQLNSQQQQNFENKKFPVAIEHCMTRIDHELAKKFILNQNSADLKQFMNVFDDFEYTEILQNLETMTPSQKSLFKFIKSYTDQLQIQRQEKQALFRQQQKSAKVQIRYFGSSFSDISILSLLMCLIVIVGLITAAIKYSQKKTIRQTVQTIKIKNKSKKKKK